MRDDPPSAPPPGEPQPAPARRRRPQPYRGPLISTSGPDPDTPLAEVRLVVGTVLGPHGIRGEMKVRPTTDDPEQFLRLRRIYLGDEEKTRKILTCRFHKGNALLRLDGIDTPEEVNERRGERLRISGKQARPLEPGEFYLYQLIGLEVIDEQETRLGVVADILETGARDVFVIRPDAGPDLLLPDLPDVVLAIDPAEKRMTVRPLRYLE